jgi:hypothetical protein
MREGSSFMIEYSTPTKTAGSTIVFLLLAAAGFGLTVVALYPGYLTVDGGFVYGFIKDWRFGDWQSPLMSMLWWLIDPISPGSGSMFLLSASLYWVAFALVALALARRSWGIGALALMLAFIPPAFMLLAMIWRDILFGTTWLLAAGAVYLASDAAARRRRTVSVLALALIGFGILLRPNALIAAPILAGYAIWPLRFEWKRIALIFIPGMIIGYAFVHLVYYVIIDAKREHPLHSLFVFDLGGITHFTGENQFPVGWNAEETGLLTSACYNPDRWDVYWTTPPCDFVMHRLEDRSDVIFGTPRLTEAWWRAVTSHPLAYLQHRFSYFWNFIAGSNLTLETYRLTDGSSPALARNDYFRSLLQLHDELKSSPLFRVGFWLAIAAGTCVLAWGGRTTASGAFALGTGGSAVVYVMTFLAVGVASDFRYAYWCVLAGIVGSVAAIVTSADRRAALRQRAEPEQFVTS